MRVRVIPWVVLVMSMLLACSSDDDASSLRASSSGNPPIDDEADGATSSTDASVEGGPANPPIDGGSDAASGLPAFETITKFGHSVIRSVTVHKNGGEDRTVYIEASKVSLLPTSGPLPNGTRLLMQVNQGSCFVIEKVAGTWQYGTFAANANPAVFATSANASCSGCHSGAAEPGVFTAGSARRLAATHKAEEITCAQGPGPTPCNATVYK